MTLGIFWVGQQTQLNHFARADRNVAWIHIAFLCAVCLIPFSTSLLAEFIRYRIALLVYWFNIFLLGVSLYWSWSFATRSRLLENDVPEEVHGPSPADRDRAIFVCGGSGALLHQYVLRDRGNCAGAGELRNRATLLLGIILEEV
jgi:hypothetical protein